METKDKVKKSIFDKSKSDSVYLTSKELSFFKENCERITGKDEEDIAKRSDFFKLAVETALDNTDHIQSQLDKANEHTKFLENELAGLLEVQKEITEKEKAIETANVIINDLKEQLNNKDDGSELRESLSEARSSNLDYIKKIKELEIQVKSKLDLLPNQIVVTLNELHTQLIDKFINDKKVIDTFIIMNKDGTHNGVYDLINTDDEKQNIANLFTSVFVGSTLKRAIVQIMPLKKVQKAINNFLKPKENVEE